jgi:glycosyltransferase involved in cell wall biosynthesis
MQTTKDEGVNSPAVSIYVACYNVGRYLTHTLSAVSRQTYPIDEVLVIDDASMDDTAAIARQHGARVISHSENRGLAAVRNTGFRAVRNEFVAALDADCVPGARWLEHCIRGFSDSRIAGVSGRRIERYTSGPGNAWREAHMSFDLGASRLKNPESIGAGHTVYRRSVVEQAGMFNERYRRAYEDVDMYRRIRNLNYDVIYEPLAVVTHVRTDSVASALETMWRYQYYAHASHDDLPGRLYNLLANVYCSALFAARDLRHLRLGLLPIDAAYAVWPVYLNWRRGSPR